jgi:hypothetical protein
VVWATDLLSFEPPDFNLVSGFPLEIGDHLGPVPIRVDESGYYENQRDQEYAGDSNRDQTGSAADIYGELQNNFVHERLAGL